MLDGFVHLIYESCSIHFLFFFLFYNTRHDRKKTFADKDINTFYSIDPKIYFDFAKFINVQNYAVTVGMKDQATSTIEYGVTLSEGKIPRKPKLNKAYG